MQNVTKVFAVICAVIMLLSFVLPNLSLAATEIQEYIEETNTDTETNEAEESNLEEESEVEEETVTVTKEEETTTLESEEEVQEVQEIPASSVIVMSTESEETEEEESEEETELEEVIITSANTYSLLRASHNLEYYQFQYLYNPSGTYLYVTQSLINAMSVYYDGAWRVGFCIQLGVDINNGTKLAEYTNDYTTDLTQVQKIAWVGWYRDHGNISVSDVYDYIYDYSFTQALIWDTLGQNPRKLYK